MSIPSNNLYEFVHQQLENRCAIFYFYPWGQKRLLNLITMKDTHYDNKEIVNLKYLPSSHPGKWWNYMPVVIAHDQEVLQYNVYEYDNLDEDSKNEILPSCIDYNDHAQNLNLRYRIPGYWKNKVVLLHSEINGTEIAKYESTGKFACAYWWSHAIISLDWYRFAKQDKRLESSNPLTTFLCYCRDTTGLRTYRKNFLRLIEEYSIKDACQLQSFNDNPVSGNSSAEYNAYDVVHTAISVVLETSFDDRIHLTEKVCRALATGHPFILVSGPGSLEYLKGYGFKTFAPIINEEYDSIQDPALRLEAIVKEMLRIESMLNKEQIYSELRKIALHNKALFFSNEFYQLIVNELVNNCTHALKQCDHWDWKYKWQIYKTRKKNNPEFYKNNREERKRILFLLRHIKKGGTLENYVPPWEN